MITNEQEKFNAWWESKGVNSVILRAQAWSAWLARAEAEQPHPQPAEDPDKQPQQVVHYDPIADRLVLKPHTKQIRQKTPVPDECDTAVSVTRDFSPEIGIAARKEDPDEWVILDPVNYADHVPRVGIDQFEHTAKAGEWITQTTMHHTLPIGPVFNELGIRHRCRRRDLPEKITTIQVNPGEGYRWLEDHEIVQPDDEVFNPAVTPCWVKPLTRAGNTVKAFSEDDYPVRRKVEQAKQCAACEAPAEPGTAGCKDCNEYATAICSPYPQPQKTRVRLWATRDGIVWMSSNACALRSWQELHHDSEGFYVEGG